MNKTNKDLPTPLSEHVILSQDAMMKESAIILKKPRQNVERKYG